MLVEGKYCYCHVFDYSPLCWTEWRKSDRFFSQVRCAMLFKLYAASEQNMLYFLCRSFKLLILYVLCLYLPPTVTKAHCFGFNMSWRCAFGLLCCLHCGEREEKSKQNPEMGNIYKIRPPCRWIVGLELVGSKNN